jgi:PAS domain S-box-containing protein
VIETTDTGFVMLDKNGLVVDANDEYLRVTGYKELEEIRGRPVTEWTAPHDLERNAEEVEKCLRYGMTRNLRIDYLDTLGRIVPIEINATYVYVGGEPRILALIRDVGDRLRAESDRLRQERLAEAVLASVPDAMVVLDPTGTIQAVNAAWREFVAQFSFADDIPVGPGGDYFEIFRRAADEGARIQQECAFGLRDVLAGRKDRHAMEFSIESDGARRWYLKRSTRLLQGDNRIVVTHVDVTDRHAQQEAAERSARSWHTLLELVPVGVFQTDAKGDCIYVNTTLCRLSGQTHEEAHGEGWVAALHPDDRARVFEEWYRAIAAGQPFALEYRLQPPSGRTTVVRSEVVPVVDPRGRASGWLGTVRDVTERKPR